MDGLNIISNLAQHKKNELVPHRHEIAVALTAEVFMLSLFLARFLLPYVQVANVIVLLTSALPDKTCGTNIC